MILSPSCWSISVGCIWGIWFELKPMISVNTTQYKKPSKTSPEFAQIQDQPKSSLDVLGFHKTTPHETHTEIIWVDASPSDESASSSQLCARVIAFVTSAHQCGKANKFGHSPNRQNTPQFRRSMMYKWYSKKLRVFKVKTFNWIWQQPSIDLLKVVGKNQQYSPNGGLV